MDRDATFASTKAFAAWEKAGRPYCEHPDFYRDGNAYGPDDVDWYCGSCGALKSGRNGDTPPPAGTRDLY